MTPTEIHRRREAPDVRRAQILKAAERVFVEDGLDASMADIAAAAGVAKGTVYLYFESKAQLLAAVRAQYIDEFSVVVLAAGSKQPSACDELEQYAGSLFDWALQNWALHHVLFHEAGFSEEDAFARGTEIFRDAIARGIDSGEVHVGDPALVADFLVQGVHGLLVATMNPAEPDRARFDRAVAELIPRALGVPRS